MEVPTSTPYEASQGEGLCTRACFCVHPHRNSTTSQAERLTITDWYRFFGILEGVMTMYFTKGQGQSRSRYKKIEILFAEYVVICDCEFMGFYSLLIGYRERC